MIQLSLTQYLLKLDHAVSRLRLATEMATFEEQADPQMIFNLMVKVDELSRQLNVMSLELEKKLPTVLDKDEHA